MKVGDIVAIDWIAYVKNDELAIEQGVTTKEESSEIREVIKAWDELYDGRHEITDTDSKLRLFYLDKNNFDFNDNELILVKEST